AETVAYVETANTSHISGLRNCGQRPIVFGYGNIHQSYRARRVASAGYSPADATAKRVIASAKRLIDVRHSCRKRSRIAEISVPAWPMPNHQTKLMMSIPHPPRGLMPKMPTPLPTRYEIVAVRIVTPPRAMRNPK